MKNQRLIVNDQEIGVLSREHGEFISLTDIARQKNAATGLVISHWLSTRFTVEFIGLWEQLYNPDFNVTEFGNIKNTAGANGFVLSAKQWIEKTKRWNNWWCFRTWKVSMQCLSVTGDRQRKE